MSGKMNWKRVEDERKILSRGSTWGGEERIPNSPSFSIPQIRNKAASRGRSTDICSSASTPVCAAPLRRKWL